MPLHVLSETHSLVSHHLLDLRDECSGPRAFREKARLLALLLCAEASRSLPQRSTNDWNRSGDSGSGREGDCDRIGGPEDTGHTRERGQEDPETDFVGVSPRRNPASRVVAGCVDGKVVDEEGGANEHVSSSTLSWLHDPPCCVRTPTGSIVQGRRVDARIAIVPILRAGLGLVDAFLDVLPSETQVWHLGFARDERTLLPVPYYSKIEDKPCNRTHFYVVDPMLGTGGTACASLQKLKNWAQDHDVHPTFVFICLVAAPEGVAKLEKEHPDVEIYTCALDERLNDHGYILPGLGDAGDRLFNT